MQRSLRFGKSRFAPIASALLPLQVRPTGEFSPAPAQWARGAHFARRLGGLRKHSALVLFSAFIPGHFVLIGEERLAALWRMDPPCGRGVDALVDKEEPGRAAGLMQIARLVLDRVLEMGGERGFASGAQAWRRLFGEQELAMAGDALTILSWAALRHARPFGAGVPRVSTLAMT